MRMRKPGGLAVSKTLARLRAKATERAVLVVWRGYQIPRHSCSIQHCAAMNQLFVARMVAVVLTATVISTAVNKYIVEPRVSKPKK